MLQVLDIGEQVKLDSKEDREDEKVLNSSRWNGPQQPSSPTSL